MRSTAGRSKYGLSYVRALVIKGYGINILGTFFG